MISIDRNSPIPLYFQLKQILLEKIEQGDWNSGALIPSEQELQDTYGVSRTTVRQTLADLVISGHLTRQQGRGTFVAEARAKLSHSPAEHQGITDFMTSQGITPGWRVLSVDWTPVPEDVAEALGLAHGVEALRLQRLRLADEEPIGYHLVYLPEPIGAKINRNALTDGESLRYLTHLPQLRSSRANRSIESIAADRTLADLLGIELGSPILRITRVVLNGDEPIEYLQANYRGDRFKYQISL